MTRSRPISWNTGCLRVDAEDEADPTKDGATILTPIP